MAFTIHSSTSIIQPAGFRHGPRYVIMQLPAKFFTGEIGNFSLYIISFLLTSILMKSYLIK